MMTHLFHLAFAVTLAATAQPQPPPSLQLVATIALLGVSGRIDDLAFHASTRRLFVAALSNNTVEVIYTAANTHLKSLPGFHEPQGIAIVSDQKAVAIANGATGTLQLIDGATLQTRWTVEVGEDADN